jgi:hypothetical protein
MGASRRRARGVAFVALGVVVVLGWLVARGAGPEQEVVKPPPPAAPGERIRVEVLNGGGMQGAARRATERLRDAGFDVVLTGNANTFDQDSSVVYDRMGRTDWAEAVAEALGIHNVEVRPDTNLYVDVSVVLGRDWAAEEADVGHGETPFG